MFSSRQIGCALSAAVIAAAGMASAKATETSARNIAPASRPVQRQSARPPARTPRAVARPQAARAAPKQAPASRPAARPTPKPVQPAQKPIAAGTGPRAPYRGAMAVDADSGRVLFADLENNTAYPASVTKLMTFLLVLEDVQAGHYGLGDKVAASAYAASMEPSSVGLRPGQTMTVDDLLYSIMVKSANDAAVALAEHAAWRRRGGQGVIPPETRGRALVDAFVDRMNRRAKELGMLSTRYASPNGLPPLASERRGFDTSTAADIAKLCRRVVGMRQALKYTSCASHTVTDGSGKPLSLSTHNYFLPGSRDKDGYARPVAGCDGLKTGFTAASGSSIALTASRDGRRVVVVVLGSAGRNARETAAGRILRDALDAVSW